mgnify:CR=1 FL=1
MSPKPIENTERISTFISKDLAKALKIKAAEKGMTVSGYIRLLIIEAVSQSK